MTEPVLFDVPDDAWVIPPPKEELSRGERRARLVATRIASGVHPLGRPVLLHADASRDPEDHATGPRCGGCEYRVQVHYHDRQYPKCWYPGRGGGVASEYVHPRDTHCESSDIRAWWPACRDYSPSEQVKGGNYTKRGVNMPGLGRRQRAVLDTMHRNGGMWPQHWKVSYATRDIFNSLIALGAVTLSDGVYRLAME